MTDLQRYFDSRGLGDMDASQRIANLVKLLDEMPVPFALIDNYELSPAWTLYRAFDNQVKAIVANGIITPRALTLYACQMTLAALTSLWTDPARQRRENEARARLIGCDFLLNGIGGLIDDTLPHGTIKIVSEMLGKEWSVAS